MVTNQMDCNVQESGRDQFYQPLKYRLKILQMDCEDVVFYHITMVSGCSKIPSFYLHSLTFKCSLENLMLILQGMDSQEKVIKKDTKNLQIYFSHVFI